MQENWQDAFRMMKLFRNNYHNCTTCAHIVLKAADGTVLERSLEETTKVFFGDYDDETLISYSKTEFPKYNSLLIITKR